MPDLSTPDGARIHYEVRGEGEPTVLLASYWSWVPGTYDDLLDDLATDHRVATYHLRGYGDSSKEGPFDIGTDTADLEALIEEIGGPAIVIATADSSNRAVDVAARRPDLIAAVVCFGAAPFALRLFEGLDGMVSSDTVVSAFIEMLESNYRGAMRSFMESTNPQMSSDELRELVAIQAEFCAAAPAVERLESWLADDPSEPGRATGGRLWIFAAANVAAAWLPPGPEVARITREAYPDAHVIEVEPGPITNPSGTAEAIRHVASAARG